MNNPCFICGINPGTEKYITERRQIQWICTGCDKKGDVEDA